MNRHIKYFLTGCLLIPLGGILGAGIKYITTTPILSTIILYTLLSIAGGLLLYFFGRIIWEIYEDKL